MKENEGKKTFEEISKKLLEELEETNKKFTILLIIQLGKLGLNSKEIAKILGVADSTVRSIFPISKLKGDKDEKTKEEQKNST